MRRFLYLALSLLIAVSCLSEKEEQAQGQNGAAQSGKPVELPELAAGESAFIAVGEFFWENKEEKTDGIMLAFEDGTEAKLLWSESSEVKKSAAIVKSTKDATFLVASVPAGKAYRAVYPSLALTSSEQSQEGIVMNIAVPAVQDGSLSGANIAVASQSQTGDSLQFKNLCGLLKFSVYSPEVASVTFRGIAGEQLVGTVPVIGFDQHTGDPIIGDPFDTVSDVKVEINGKTGTFYVAVLPGLMMEEGFEVSFEMIDGSEQTLDNAKSNYQISTTRSSYTVLGTIEDYIPQLNWFVTPEGAGEMDGKSWENAISAEQMFQMLAFNRAVESGVGNSTTDVAADAYKEACAEYLQIHNTRHALQLDGVTFHLAAGEYRTTNYVRVSFPDLGRQVSICLKGGYDPSSEGQDLSKRDSEQFTTKLIKPYGSGTARMFFFQQWLNMVIDGLTFYGGTGDGTVGGGAILLNESESSEFTFANCNFDSNSSNSYGGAIVGSKLVGRLIFDNCRFTKNVSAKDGAAIHTTSGSWTFNDCVFLDNKSSANGGAMRMGAEEFSAINVVFEGNTCTPDSENNGQGGAIYFAKNENAIGDRLLKDCTFKGNTVNAVNAVYNNDVKRYVRGGAIYVAGVPKLVINGGSFTSNEQIEYTSYKKYGGGAIYSVAEVSMFDVTFSGNEAYNGGALGFEGAINCTDCTFTENGGQYGAAISGTSSPSFIGCKFTGNKSDIHGGVIYANKATSEITFRECEFTQNSSVDNGGVAWLNPVKSVIFDACTFTSNTVTGTNMGGVAYLSGASNLTVKDGQFTNNAAGKSGGAFYHSGTGTILISGSTFNGNSAGAEYGGAIYGSGTTTWNLLGSEFKNNTSSKSGGVIYYNGTGTVSIADTNFEGNNAVAEHGGAIHGDGNAVWNITKSTFKSNTAMKEAGAIRFVKGTWDISETQFKENSAESNGGAIYSNTGSLNLSQCEFNGNSTSTTGVGGGAIYVTTNSVLSVDASKFISNSAPNKNGGAINIASTAKGLHKINNTHFSGNDAIEGGAMFLAAGGTLYINGCSFSGNVPSKADTGGVLKTNTTTFMNNCSFCDNPTGAWQADLILCGTATVLNTTVIEKSSSTSSTHTNGIRVYGTSNKALIYNNVILSRNRNLAVGYGSNVGDVTSQGYNYTGKWSTQVNTGLAASATTVDTDNVVTPTNVFDSFTKSTGADGRNWYTWSAPEGINMTTLDGMKTFLNGVSGGSDFATWLNTVNGLSHDIAGNPRPSTGSIYPGCYQKN